MRFERARMRFERAPLGRVHPGWRGGDGSEALSQCKGSTGGTLMCAPRQLEAVHADAHSIPGQFIIEAPSNGIHVGFKGFARGWRHSSGGWRVPCAISGPYVAGLEVCRQTARVEIPSTLARIEREDQLKAMVSQHICEASELEHTHIP